MSVKFSTERHEHAAQVIAHGMDGDPKSPAYIQALHSLLTHERHRGLIMPGHVSDAPLDAEAEAFDRLRQVGIMYGESCKQSWDGWQFAWEDYAERLLRSVESIYTYFVPAEKVSA